MLTDVKADYLFKVLWPFLRHVPQLIARAELADLEKNGHLTTAQMERIMELWEEQHTLEAVKRTAENIPDQ